MQIEKINNIIESYKNGYTTDVIVSTYSISLPTLYSILKRYNIPLKGCQKYKINENYFSIIDTPEKAYWLGFIFADGCVSNYRLTLSLHIQDDYILNYLKESLESEIPIYTDRPTQKRFSVYNKKIALDLNNLNIVKQKTYSNKFPLVPSNMYKYFICGYFDGDGGVSLTKKTDYCCLTFTCYTRSILETVKTILLQFDIESNISEKTSGKAFDLIISKYTSIKLFYENLYSDSPFIMKRKHDKLYNWLYNRSHSPKFEHLFCIECGAKHIAKGLCKRCYDQKRYYNN